MYRNFRFFSLLYIFFDFFFCIHTLNGLLWMIDDVLVKPMFEDFHCQNKIYMASFSSSSPLLICLTTVPYSHPHDEHH